MGSEDVPLQENTLEPTRKGRVEDPNMKNPTITKHFPM